jgi:hypothetical protein
MQILEHHESPKAPDFFSSLNSLGIQAIMNDYDLNIVGQLTLFPLYVHRYLFYLFSRSSRNFGEDLEDPRSDRIYSSGNRGVKKGPGPRGTRDEEFLVPSLISP